MKKQIRKSTTLLAALLALVLSFGGCGGAGGNSTPASNGGNSPAESGGASASAAGEATVVTWYESTDNKAFADAVAAAFNASRQDIQCEVVYIPQDSYEDKMKSLLAGGGSEVDVFHAGNVAPTNLYGANGATLDLAPYLEKTELDLDKFGGKTRFVTQEDGRIVGMPEGWGGWFLFYNKDFFDATGEPYPTELTWTQYADLAAKLTDKANGKWGGYHPSWIYNLYAIQKGNYLSDDNIEPLAEAVQLMNRLYNTDNSHMDIAEMKATGADPVSMFETGNVAMMINGEWTISQIRAEEDAGAGSVNWGMTYLPVPEGVEPKTGVGGVSFIAINANSKHPDESWEFIEFLVGPEGASIYASNGNLPAYVTDEIGQGYIDFHKGIEAAHLPFDSELTINAEQGTYARYAELVEILKQNAELYLMGEVSIEEFKENFIADRQAVMG